MSNFHADVWREVCMNDSLTEYKFLIVHIHTFNGIVSQQRWVNLSSSLMSASCPLRNLETSLFVLTASLSVIARFAWSRELCLKWWTKADRTNAPLFVTDHNVSWSTGTLSRISSVNPMCNMCEGKRHESVSSTIIPKTSWQPAFGEVNKVLVQANRLTEHWLSWTQLYNRTHCQIVFQILMRVRIRNGSELVDWLTVAFVVVGQ